jgi:hypothetical protein
MDFKPNTPAFKRVWHKLWKRASLELENLSHGRKGYVLQRITHLWDVVRVRTSIAYQNMTGKNLFMSPELSKLYFFEALGVEHKKAMDQYRPAPYDGDVVVFRASKQLGGLIADEKMGWKNTFVGNFDVCDVPGHQQNLLQEPNVSGLAKEFSSRLKAAQQKSNKESRKRARELAFSK